MIAILDYGGGNVGSVQKAVEYLGGKTLIASRPEEFRQATKLILPGQGHFGAMMKALRANSLLDPLREWIASSKPILGICLGLQALYTASDEAPEESGLELLDGTVRRFDAVFKVPHIGWSTIETVRSTNLLKGIPNGSFVYYCHSYYCPITAETSAVTQYGERFAAASEIGAVVAVQFHPEKSGEVGLRVLRNFLET